MTNVLGCIKLTFFEAFYHSKGSVIIYLTFLLLQVLFTHSPVGAFPMEILKHHDSFFPPILTWTPFDPDQRPGALTFDHSGSYLTHFCPRSPESIMKAETWGRVCMTVERRSSRQSVWTAASLVSAAWLRAVMMPCTFNQFCVELEERSPTETHRTHGNDESEPAMLEKSRNWNLYNGLKQWSGPWDSWYRPTFFFYFNLIL